MTDPKTVQAVQAHMATLNLQPCSGCADLDHSQPTPPAGLQHPRKPVWAFVDLFSTPAVPEARLLATSKPAPPKSMTVARIVCMHCGFVRDFAWPPRPRELLGRAVKG